MELCYFKDKLFDLLNDNEEMGIADLNADEQNKLLIARAVDGRKLSTFDFSLPFCYI